MPSPKTLDHWTSVRDLIERHDPTVAGSLEYGPRNDRIVDRLFELAERESLVQPEGDDVDEAQEQYDRLEALAKALASAERTDQRAKITLQLSDAVDTYGALLPDEYENDRDYDYDRGEGFDVNEFFSDL